METVGIDNSTMYMYVLLVEVYMPTNYTGSNE